MRNICVIDSLNIDLTVTIPRFHNPGETISGTDFSVFTGRKGGNQAVAAAKLSMDTRMVGKIGNDINGNLYRKTLETLSIHNDSVETISNVPSGVTLIEVDAFGENRIVVVVGTNALVDRSQIDRCWDAINGCDVLLLQLEIPMGEGGADKNLDLLEQEICHVFLRGTEAGCGALSKV